MDKIAVSFLLLSSLCGSIKAGLYSTCEMEGMDDDYWMSYTFPDKIDDTFRGEIASFKTKNVIQMKIKSNSYLTATWENQILHILTAEDFDDFEKETDNTMYGRISVSLMFECEQDGSETITFNQEITDTNNHAPLLNKDRYDYDFGTTIPKGTILTDILPIKGYDPDLTNEEMFFSIDANDFIKIERRGESSYAGKDYATTLTVLKDIVPPFNQIFTLIATDSGAPEKSTETNLTLRVEHFEKESEDETMVHPPVFRKHLYFARYNSEHQFELEEPIVIKHGAESKSVLKQIGYEEYFKAVFADTEHSTIEMQQLSELTDEILDSKDYITVEIEVENEGLTHMSGITAVLIRLPKLDKKLRGGEKLVAIERDSSSEDSKEQVDNKENEKHNHKKSDVENYYYSHNGYVIPLILFLLTVFSIVFINIFVIIMFTKNKDLFA